MGIVLRTEYKDCHIEMAKEYDDLPWFLYISYKDSMIRCSDLIGSENQTEGQMLDKAIMLIEQFFKGDKS